MDTSNNKTQIPVSSAGSTALPKPDAAKTENMKAETISAAKAYAKAGKKTRKEPLTDGSDQSIGYDWWENQGTFEDNIWSVALWDYDNKKWQLQATKVELQKDGHTRMTSYSMRVEDDPSFPGFQVYIETKDELYHPAQIEDIVYLHRIITSLKPN